MKCRETETQSEDEYTLHSLMCSPFLLCCPLRGTLGSLSLVFRLRARDSFWALLLMRGHCWCATWRPLSRPGPEGGIEWQKANALMGTSLVTLSEPSCWWGRDCTLTFGFGDGISQWAAVASLPAYSTNSCVRLGRAVHTCLCCPALQPSTCPGFPFTALPWCL